MSIEIFNALQIYSDYDGFENACFHKLDSFHWESPTPYRPETYCKIGIVGKNIFAQLKCYEKNPKTVYENRDDPIYKDSCLEFFIKPLADKKEYINIECNSKGVFLCEIGEGKHNRRLLKAVTEASPEVRSFNGKDLKGSFWAVTIELTEDFIKSVFAVDAFDYTVVECNFYKCGDDCATPHYLAYSPVTTLPPGFHNPECFAKFKIIK